MAGSVSKVTADEWLDAARKMLIDRSIGAVKVDLLAKRFGVTRGGFYHHFKSRDDLLERLLDDWRNHCRFLPNSSIPDDPTGAIDWYDQMVSRLIHEEGYDHRYDMAVREWGRSDTRVATAVASIDEKRIRMLTRFFSIIGYSATDAKYRANVFYFHQIGYYAIGVQEPAGERLQHAGIYGEILCGPLLTTVARV